MGPLVLLIVDLTVGQALRHLLHNGARGLVNGEQLVLSSVEHSNLGPTILRSTCKHQQQDSDTA